VPGFANGAVELASIYRRGEPTTVDCESLLVVGVRESNDNLYSELTTAGIQSLRQIGDCRAPGAIAHAVYSGHECARTIDDSGASEYAWERPRLGL